MHLFHFFPLAALPRRHQKHHRPAHFILHALQIHHVFRRLRLNDVPESKTVLQQCLQIGGQRPVIFYHMLAQKNGVPLPFIILVVHRKIQDIAVSVIIPVLGAVSRERRMLHRKDKVSAGLQPAPDARHQRRKVLHVMKGQ